MGDTETKRAVMLAELRIRDLAGIREYAQQVAPVVQRCGGRVIARSAGAIECLEGEWRPSLLVVQEWPSAQRFHEFYASPEYQPLRALRQRSAETSLVLFEVG